MRSGCEPVKKRVGAARGPLFIGYFALCVLICVIGVWSVQARIAGAVIASGMIEVENNRQILQHPQGGVVGELLARDGDRVEAGDVVLRFDDQLLQSELAIVTNQLNVLCARKARLVAEADETDTIAFDTLLLAAAAENPEINLLIDGQTRLFRARNKSLEQEEEQIENQVVQTKDQITGSSRQLAATQYQSALLIDELADVQTLFDKGLAQASRVSALKRERARLLGEVGQFEARIAQLEGDIARLEIEKLRLRSVRREQAIASLRDLSVQEIELAERELSTRDTLSKMAMRTPVSGVIYGSRVFAVQSVISPADPVMYVIPQDQPLIVAARIAAIHIDQVHAGQDAALRFSAFDQRTTPEIFGTVSKISADVYTDEVSGQTYYLANLVPKSGELAKLDTQVLLPGMPVETFIRTVERSPFSYLVKPLMDYFNKAFRED